MIEMVISPTIAPTIQMASIGVQDTMFLMVLALIVFGPRRLPEIGRQIGKLMYEFRKVSNEFKFQMEEELRASEEADRQAKLKAAAVAAPEMLPAPAQFTPGTDTVAVTETGSDSEAAAAETAATDTMDAAARGTATDGLEPAVAGEVRGEARKFPPAIQPPTIQPPSTGEIVQATRPYRSWSEPTGAEAGEQAPGHEVAALHATDTNGTAAISDHGQTGTEVAADLDPAVSQGTEREANHA